MLRFVHHGAVRMETVCSKLFVSFLCTLIFVTVIMTRPVENNSSEEEGLTTKQVQIPEMVTYKVITGVCEGILVFLAAPFTSACAPVCITVKWDALPGVLDIFSTSVRFTNNVPGTASMKPSSVTLFERFVR